MADGVAARRYAQAVFEIAKERKELDRWLDDLRLVAGVAEEPRVARFLADPDVPFEKKQLVLTKSLRGLNPLALNLLYLLIQRGRLQIVQQIRQEFEKLVNEQRGIEVAEVTTAVPLGDEEAAAVARRLESLTGKKIVLRQNVDAGIIGGVIARVGDKLVDGSLRGRLERLRHQLKT